MFLLSVYSDPFSCLSEHGLLLLIESYKTGCPVRYQTGQGTLLINSSQSVTVTAILKIRLSAVDAVDALLDVGED